MTHGRVCPAVAFESIIVFLIVRSRAAGGVVNDCPANMQTQYQRALLCDFFDDQTPDAVAARATTCDEASLIFMSHRLLCLCGVCSRVLRFAIDMFIHIATRAIFFSWSLA